MPDPDAITLMNTLTRPGLVPEDQARAVLAAWDIPLAPHVLANDLENALKAAEQIGYPVALKVQSSRIIHKTDAGGVHLNVFDPAALRSAYENIERRCALIDPTFQVAVEPMLPPGIEVIVGVSRDDQFGPVLMFGLGGIMVELYKDVVFSLIPITAKRASEMVVSIKAYPLLNGFRDRPRVAIEQVERLLLSVSELVHCCPQVGGLDLNPVLLYPQEAIVVDARLEIRPV